MKEYKFRIGNNAYCVKVEGIKDGIASVNVNGVDYEVELENAPVQAVEAAPAAKSAAPVEAPAAESPKAAAPAGGKTITSPLPGVIVSVDVKEGQSVKRGQKVAVLEAMKMENDILAECDGTVGQVFVQKGDSLLEGAKICTIA